MSLVVERVIEQMGLDRLLSDDGFHYNPRQGVLYNPAQTRICLLSTDLLSGVHRALEDEAGEAWTVILKSCGQTWGSRLARRLDRELQTLGGTTLGDTPIGQLSQSLQRYFGFHGWGDLTLQLDLAQTRGVLQAELRDSIFAEVIRESSLPVDCMLAGILASLFSYLSQHSLDCLQTACTTQGAAVSRFVITSPERTARARELLEQGVSHQELVESI